MNTVSARLSQLPPYVLARIDDLKREAIAQGRETFDFGLGNPDGKSPAAVVARIHRELVADGFQRYMPSRGLPEVRAAICEWYRERYDVHLDADREAVVTIGSKEGIAHLLLALVNPGDCVVVPDPAYPIHQKGVAIAGGQVIPYAVGAGRDHAAEIARAFSRAPRRPKGILVNFPHNPTTACADLSFYEAVVALALRENAWIISDLAYADLCFDGRSAPSIFQVARAREVAVEFFTVSKSYSMPGWRVGFCVGRPDLVGALSTIKGYLDYGIFCPVQRAAATALQECDADVAANRALYRHRAQLLTDVLGAAGWPVTMPDATMFVWAPIPEKFRAAGALAFATELLEKAGVAVAPGTGFGPGGEGFVRFSLIEPDERVRQAGQRIQRLLAQVEEPTVSSAVAM